MQRYRAFVQPLVNNKGIIDVPASNESVSDWCTKLIHKSPDFPPLEDCLDAIAQLNNLTDLPAGTRVLVRGDTDVVVAEDGAIADDVRLRSLLETLNYGCEKKWVQIVYGHRGRDPEWSLEPVAAHLQKLLQDSGLPDAHVNFVDDWLDEDTGEVLDSAAEFVANCENGSVVVLENTRRYTLERLLWNATEKDLPELAGRVANYANSMREKLAAVHVNEGFAASNRDLSSTIVPLTMDRCALGRYIDSELREYVTRARLADLVIFSGIKINKLDDLAQILNRGQVKMVIAAGSLAMALKKASDDSFAMGLADDPAQKIYIPPERIEQARRMLDVGKQSGVEFVLPIDFVLGDGSNSETIPAGEAQFDVGPKTVALQAKKIGEFIHYHSKKISAENEPAVAFHNGVFGKFEEERFSHGTEQFISQLKRMHAAGVEVYVGGGEGGAALHRYGDESWVTHCFTAGGTILKALGSEPIPYIKALYLNATANA